MIPTIRTVPPITWRGDKIPKTAEKEYDGPTDPKYGWVDGVRMFWIDYKGGDPYFDCWWLSVVDKTTPDGSTTWQPETFCGTYNQCVEAAFSHLQSLYK